MSMLTQTQYWVQSGSPKSQHSPEGEHYGMYAALSNSLYAGVPSRAFLAFRGILSQPNFDILFWQDAHGYS